MNGIGFIDDTATGSVTPSSMFNISQVSINESFSPLMGVDMTFNNNMTLKAEYRQTRVLSLSMTSVQVNEALSKDWVVGMGYRLNNLSLFGRGKRAIKSKGKNKNQSNAAASNRNSGTNQNLNLRLDFSFRRQAAIVRHSLYGEQCQQWKQGAQAEFLGRLHPQPAPHHELLLRPSDQHSSALEQQLSHHHAGLRSECQVLADEIRMFREDSEVKE